MGYNINYFTYQYTKINTLEKKKVNPSIMTLPTLKQRSGTGALQSRQFRFHIIPDTNILDHRTKILFNSSLLRITSKNLPNLSRKTSVVTPVSVFNVLSDELKFLFTSTLRCSSASLLPEIWIQKLVAFVKQNMFK